MKKDKEKLSLSVLSRIEKEIPDNFGEPLLDALRKTFASEDNENIEATAIIGMLYLSHRLAKYPQTKLRTYCCNLREEYPLLPLDCRHYDEICSAITGGLPTQATLIDDSLSSKSTMISKEHILEALDFISNG